MTISDPKTNLVWADLEMTGLDVNNCRILKIAALVTNADLEIISDDFVQVIHQEDDQFVQMDSWNQKHHKESGLIEESKNSGVDEKTADLSFLNFLKKYVNEKASPLCGNTIQTDRKFLEKYLPLTNNYLSHRYIDVSSIKEITLRWHDNENKFKRSYTGHHPLPEVREAIKELAYYRKFFFVNV